MTELRDLLTRALPILADAYNKSNGSTSIKRLVAEIDAALAASDEDLCSPKHDWFVHIGEKVRSCNHCDKKSFSQEKGGYRIGWSAPE